MLVCDSQDAATALGVPDVAKFLQRGVTLAAIATGGVCVYLSIYQCIYVCIVLVCVLYICVHVGVFVC